MLIKYMQTPNFQIIVCAVYEFEFYYITFKLQMCILFATLNSNLVAMTIHLFALGINK